MPPLVLLLKVTVLTPVSDQMKSATRSCGACTGLIAGRTAVETLARMRMMAVVFLEGLFMWSPSQLGATVDKGWRVDCRLLSAPFGQRPLAGPRAEEGQQGTGAVRP